MQAGQLRRVCGEMYKMRRTALFVNVMAALRGEVLTVTHLGRSIASEVKEKHCISERTACCPIAVCRGSVRVENRRLREQHRQNFVDCYAAIRRSSIRVNMFWWVAGLLSALPAKMP